MKQIITDKEIGDMIDEIMKDFPLETLLEAPVDIPNRKFSPQPQKHVSRPVVKKYAKRPVNRTVTQPVQNPPTRLSRDVKQKPVVKPKPTSQTIPGPNDKEPIENPNAYSPEQAKEKQKMTKTQYQIFNIKMRLGKLGLNDTVRRFVQSIHDFDINVTKNSTDDNDIKSYLSPAQGNLVALMGALESLKAEFAELEKLVNKE